MGGSSSKEVTTGYKFSVGMQMVLCYGTIDAVKKILIEDKFTLVQGNLTAGEHRVNQSNLFGGADAQGGIEGVIEVWDGRRDQTKSDYLYSKQTAPTRLGKRLLPAYRGVASLVLRGFGNSKIPNLSHLLGGGGSGGTSGMYMGNNPYLKPWKVLVQRIMKKTDGSEQWLPDFAKIPSHAPAPKNIYLLIALDCSASMSTGNRFQNMKNQVSRLLEMFYYYGLGSNSIINIGVTGWSGTTNRRVYKNATESDLLALITFVQNLNLGASTNFERAFSQVDSFFTTTQPTSETQQYMFFITDGQATGSTADTARTNNLDFITQKGIWANTPVTITGFNIDLNDTTDTAKVVNNGVRVISGSDENALIDAGGISFGFKYWDMNPAHIVLEALTDRQWGKGIPLSEIDVQSFENAAKKLFAEGLGLSVIWGHESAVDDFVEMIRKHIDAVLYDEPTTGKLTLKLIRDDYDLDSLVHLDESNIISINDFTRPVFSELINQVVVKYNDITDKDKGVITLQQNALLEMQGELNSTTVNYDAVTNMNVANRLAARDLKSLSSPLIGLEVGVFKSVGRTLRMGQCVKLSLVEHNLTEKVMRITGISYGNGVSNAITISLVEDAFSLPTEGFVSEFKPINKPTEELYPINIKQAFEVPYYLAVMQFGEADVVGELGRNPHASYLMAVAGRNPLGANATNAKLFTRNTAFIERPLENVDTVDFAPIAVTQTELSYSTSVFTTTIFRDTARIDTTRLPLLGLIGEEFVTVTAVELIEGETQALKFTLQRGVLDTHPTEHAIGSNLIIFGQYWAYDSEAYVEGDEVEWALVPYSFSQVGEVSVAEKGYLEMGARAIRPYPPQNVQIDDQYFPESVSGSFTIKWATRNRIQQTGASFVSWYDGNVISEAGVTYNLRVYLNNTLVHERTGLTETSVTLTNEDVSDGVARVELTSVRDGFECFKPFVHEFERVTNEIYLTVDELSYTRISGTANNSAVVTITVDDGLTANVNTSGTEISGNAPAGSEVTITVEDED